MSRATVIINGRADREKICRWAMGVKTGTRVEFKEAKRSTDQNSLMWVLLFAKHIAQAPENTERNELLAKRVMELSYALGRKEGIEEAAKVAASGKIYAHVTTGEPPTARPIEHRGDTATAIRQLLEVKG